MGILIGSSPICVLSPANVARENSMGWIMSHRSIRSGTLALERSFFSACRLLIAAFSTLVSIPQSIKMYIKHSFHGVRSYHCRFPPNNLSWKMRKIADSPTSAATNTKIRHHPEMSARWVMYPTPARNKPKERIVLTLNVAADFS
jgi:hypothetical protein